MRQDRKIEFLEQFKIFKGVSEQRILKLSYFLKEKVMRRRDVLFKEGDMVDGLYFVKDGELEISMKYKSEETKRIN